MSVSATPFHLGLVTLVEGDEAWRQRPDAADTATTREGGGWIKLSVADGKLIVERLPGIVTPNGTAGPMPVDLTTFSARQAGEHLVDPWIDFAFDGTAYRIAVEFAGFKRVDGQDVLRVTGLQGQLFADRSPMPTP